MNVVKTLRAPKNIKIAGIDASSTAIAITVLEQVDGDVFIKDIFKLKLAGKEMQEKLRIVSSFLSAFFEKYPDLEHIFIEQPIYIQNPATSRVLSQISGHIWGECLKSCQKVTEVIISNWKSYIGYKNVSRAEKEAWAKEFGDKEAKKMAASERKQRTIRLIHDKIPTASHIVDNDICDSIGIALWGLNQENKHAS